MRMSDPINQIDTLEKQSFVSVEEHLSAPKHKQKKLLIILTVVFLISLSIYSIYWFIYLNHFQSTDDAYVNGNIVPITSQVTGNIIAIDADDTTFIQQGSVLVRLDKTDSQAIFEQAKATLELTLRQTAQYFVRDAGLQAVIDARQASVQQANSDLKRRQRAVNIGGVSKEELIHAEDTFRLANSSLIEAKSQWQANRALINNISIAKHPAVVQAIAKCRQAYFNIKRTTIYAPISGYVARRLAQVGQRITGGSFLMSIVPLDEVWVDANFKEKQLRLMRVGHGCCLSWACRGFLWWYGKCICIITCTKCHRKLDKGSTKIACTYRFRPS
jgi:membrane fusion protein (multidrug efflux system)